MAYAGAATSKWTAVRASAGAMIRLNTMTTDREFPEDDDPSCYDEDEEEYWAGECGLGPDGQCSKAGSEEFDFCCPNRNSEWFAGSAAWNKKHSKGRRK